MSHIHSNKSPGLDGICIELYKCTIEYILPYLNIVFNDIFSNFELGFPVPNMKAGGAGLIITKSQACTTAEGGANR